MKFLESTLPLSLAAAIVGAALGFLAGTNATKTQLNEALWLLEESSCCVCSRDADEWHRRHEKLKEDAK